MDTELKDETVCNLLCKRKNDVWFSIDLGSRQLNHLKMVCKFHIAESENEDAKRCTRKLLYCLEKMSKPSPAPAG